MVRTKLVARDYYRSQKDRFQNPARFAAVKRKEKKQNKKIKINKLLPQFKNAEVKKNRRVVREMVVRGKSIFPPSRRLREY